MGKESKELLSWITRNVDTFLSSFIKKIQKFVTTKVRRSSRGNCKLSVSNFFYLASLRAIGTIAGWRTSFCANISTEFASHKTLNGVAATFDSYLLPLNPIYIRCNFSRVIRHSSLQSFYLSILRINFAFYTRDIKITRFDRSNLISPPHLLYIDFQNFSNSIYDSVWQCARSKCVSSLDIVPR